MSEAGVGHRPAHEAADRAQHQPRRFGFGWVRNVFRRGPRQPPQQPHQEHQGRAEGGAEGGAKGGAKRGAKGKAKGGAKGGAEGGKEGEGQPANAGGNLGAQPALLHSHDGGSGGVRGACDAAPGALASRSSPAVSSLAQSSSKLHSASDTCIASRQQAGRGGAALGGPSCSAASSTASSPAAAGSLARDPSATLPPTTAPPPSTPAAQLAGALADDAPSALEQHGADAGQPQQQQQHAAGTSPKACSSLVEAGGASSSPGVEAKCAAAGGEPLQAATTTASTTASTSATEAVNGSLGQQQAECGSPLPQAEAGKQEAGKEPEDGPGAAQQPPGQGLADGAPSSRPHMGAAGQGDGHEATGTAVQGLFGLNMLLVRLWFELLNATFFETWARNVIQVRYRLPSRHTGSTVRAALPCRPLAHAPLACGLPAEAPG